MTTMRLLHTNLIKHLTGHCESALDDGQMHGFPQVWLMLQIVQQWQGQTTLPSPNINFNNNNTNTNTQAPQRRGI
jgi:hypothetical protein